MKKALATIMIVLMLIPAVGAGTIDGSVTFLSGVSQSTKQTREVSLALMALISARDDVKWDVTPDIEVLVDELLKEQNADGGWGYYFNEPSNVLDTSYAVIALTRAYPLMDVWEARDVKRAIDAGINYLLSAKEENGWGYVPGTPVSCYPTVVALWALGENGYTYNSRTVRDAVKYLESVNASSCEISSYEFLALRVIAYHSTGYPLGSEVADQLKDVLLKENLETKERAMLTYALVLVSPLDLDVARALKMLEEEGRASGDVFFWFNTPKLTSQTEVIASTSFALMALSHPLKVTIPSEAINPYAMPCRELKNMQNPDGGWGLVLNEPSDEKATYYALLGLEKCYPTNESVERALSWVRGAYERDSLWVRENGRMSVGYYYALETLLHYGLLGEEEKAQAIETIRNAQLDYGLWGNTVLGPQPYDTALAVKALLDLGVPANDTLIQAAKEWLLSISSGGWGTHVTTPHFSYMLKPDVLTTITVLEALEEIATPDELKPHLEWLIEQRVNGGWAYWKAYYVWQKNREYPGTPSVELTVRATDLLLRHGYNYTSETLDFVMNARDSGLIRNKPIETASAILYLSRFQYIPPVSLNDVRAYMDTDLFEVIAPEMENESVAEIVDYLNDAFSGGFIASNGTEIGDGSYIVIANFGDYSIRPYNPYLPFHIGSDNVTVGNVTVPMNGSVALIPGKTPEGVVLFVLYGQGGEETVRDIFTTGFIKYIGGSAMVFVSENGRVRVIVVG
ncbi:hypothetical protein CL1_0766 [Thermococcus cleftensis]|uniref:Squalene cyclase C-terminal domain-containing protein n=1 Tax=Thermococcus cleftensis (strain DSM 27260 / KACC 17922 / CL1) TaxID=163003 RepID=I3ZTD7_THECF|nr:prenyltransferase/squalene oxidase repeat-containing protein [Thermococcus cleftensis]AFL94971.1 hypothetical protein CL1_0766 [Thermococcus cleftensis]